MYIEVISYIKNIVSNTNRSTQSKKESREAISYAKHISSSVQLQTQAKKESREVASYAKHIQTLISRHRREFVSVNSFISHVHFETLIKQKQTLTKNEDRNISSYIKPIVSNISCQTKKEILRIYAYAHHEENLSNTYTIENPSYVEVI
ncbi:hypothetical protein SAMN05216169_103217 [Anoxybacillus pushchinoensis]|uniref:Uncharacterized protein n=1 Tax=Anoxybacillus pushchinoensis TaxID=150248 RepID=A0A1I0TMX2_9BACL|nr:hypothetical protein [Anoxybacillus pushchinoensis]SFA52336.1 hypothetical protein SAMN05216169_103217 [Anoxybacillus pushchinoensis]